MKSTTISPHFSSYTTADQVEPSRPISGYGVFSSRACDPYVLSLLDTLVVDHYNLGDV